MEFLAILTWFDEEIARSLFPLSRSRHALFRSSAASAPLSFALQGHDESLSGSWLRLASCCSTERAIADRCCCCCCCCCAKEDLLDLDPDLFLFLRPKKEDERRRCRRAEEGLDQEPKEPAIPSSRRLRPRLVRSHARPHAGQDPTAGDGAQERGQPRREQRPRAQGPLHGRLGGERV